MKPYLLIAGEQYYPESGTGDWVACFETYEEAKEEVVKVTVPRYRSSKMDDKYCIRGANYDWYNIVDLREWME